MATRPVVQAQNLIVLKMAVASGQAVTKGYAVVHSGSDTEIDNAGADSDLAIGVALEDGAAGELVDVALVLGAHLRVDRSSQASRQRNKKDARTRPRPGGGVRGPPGAIRRPSPPRRTPRHWAESGG